MKQFLKKLRKFQGRRKFVLPIKKALHDRFEYSLFASPHAFVKRRKS